MKLILEARKSSEKVKACEKKKKKWQKNRKKGKQKKPIAVKTKRQG